jgi:hypothetical protein
VLTCWIATREPSNQIIAYHVEPMTLDDGDYELILEQDQGFSEDPVNVVETITEAPNQSSEIRDTPAPNPAQEGKPRCITQYFNLLQCYNYILYLALSLGVEMEP